jgi:hypothetical protein
MDVTRHECQLSIKSVAAFVQALLGSPDCHQNFAQRECRLSMKSIAANVQALPGMADSHHPFAINVP